MSIPVSGRARWITAILGVLLLVPAPGAAQYWLHDDGSETNRSIFRPIDAWAAPNEFRSASGAPGYAYWQQRADYVIEARLDAENHVLNGSERVTYRNNSPDRLDFLWLQLDQNVRSLEYSRAYEAQAALPEQISPAFRRYVGVEQFDGGHDITRVQLVTTGGVLVDAEYRINGTIMRIDLVETLEPGGEVDFEIDWSFRIPDSGRGGKELVADGWLYEMAQWFPRMSVYDDVNGWQTEQFIGRGEFYLNFGDYDVSLTVPWDHIVDGTGVLQNPAEVLTSEQLERLDDAYTSEEPSFIVGADEVGDPSTRPVNEGR